MSSLQEGVASHPHGGQCVVSRSSSGNTRSGAVTTLGARSRRLKEMVRSIARLSLIPTRWLSEDCRPKHHEDNVLIYGIAGLPRYRAGDVRRSSHGTWELWLTDGTGVLRPVANFDSPRAALHACEVRESGEAMRGRRPRLGMASTGICRNVGATGVAAAKSGEA